MEVMEDVQTYWMECFVPARLAYDLKYIDAVHQRLTDLMTAQGFSVVTPAKSRVIENREGFVATRMGYAVLEATIQVREFDVPVEVDESVDCRVEVPTIPFGA